MHCTATRPWLLLRWWLWPTTNGGEVPCAFVELAEGAGANEQELLEYARERLAGFKRPKKVVFGELPKTTTGKIRKNELRARLQQTEPG